MKKFLPLLALVLTTSVLTACSNKTEEISTTEKPSQTTPQAPEASTNGSETPPIQDIAAINQKLNYYVDCINGHSNRALDSYNRYLSWTNEQTGPTGSEQIIYGLYTLPIDITDCVAGIKTALSSKPSYAELDKAAGAYSEALQKIDPLLDEADEYYTEQNYKDDAMAKGKEMHPKLIAAFKSFETADNKMRSELDVIQDELDQERLIALEKSEGKKYAWHTTNVMIMAKKVWNESDVGDFKDVKVDLLQPAITNLEKAVDDLKAYNTKHKSEEETGFSSFLSDSNDLVTASKELMRRARDKKEYNSGELMNIGGPGEWMVDGSPGKVLDAYNDLISSSNMIMQF